MPEYQEDEGERIENGCEERGPMRLDVIRPHGEEKYSGDPYEDPVRGPPMRRLHVCLLGDGEVVAIENEPQATEEACSEQYEDASKDDDAVQQRPVTHHSSRPADERGAHDGQNDQENEGGTAVVSFQGTS